MLLLCVAYSIYRTLCNVMPAVHRETTRHQRSQEHMKVCLTRFSVQATAATHVHSSRMSVRLANKRSPVHPVALPSSPVALSNAQLTSQTDSTIKCQSQTIATQTDSAIDTVPAIGDHVRGPLLRAASAEAAAEGTRLLLLGSPGVLATSQQALKDNSESIAAIKTAPWMLLSQANMQLRLKPAVASTATQTEGTHQTGVPLACSVAQADSQVEQPTEKQLSESHIACHVMSDGTAHRHRHNQSNQLDAQVCDKALAALSGTAAGDSSIETHAPVKPAGVRATAAGTSAEVLTPAGTHSGARATDSSTGHLEAAATNSGMKASTTASCGPLQQRTPAPLTRAAVGSPQTPLAGAVASSPHAVPCGAAANCPQTSPPGGDASCLQAWPARPAAVRLLTRSSSIQAARISQPVIAQACKVSNTVTPQQGKASDTAKSLAGKASDAAMPQPGKASDPKKPQPGNVKPGMKSPRRAVAMSPWRVQSRNAHFMFQETAAAPAYAAEDSKHSQTQQATKLHTTAEANDPPHLGSPRSRSRSGMLWSLSAAASPAASAGGVGASAQSSQSSLSAAHPKSRPADPAPDVGHPAAQACKSDCHHMRQSGYPGSESEDSATDYTNSICHTANKSAIQDDVQIPHVKIVASDSHTPQSDDITQLPTDPMEIQLCTEDLTNTSTSTLACHDGQSLMDYLEVQLSDGHVAPSGNASQSLRGPLNIQVSKADPTLSNVSPGTTSPLRCRLHDTAVGSNTSPAKSAAGGKETIFGGKNFGAKAPGSGAGVSPDQPDINGISVGTSQELTANRTQRHSPAVPTADAMSLSAGEATRPVPATPHISSPNTAAAAQPEPNYEVMQPPSTHAAREGCQPLLDSRLQPSASNMLKSKTSAVTRSTAAAQADTQVVASLPTQPATPTTGRSGVQTCDQMVLPDSDEALRSDIMGTAGRRVTRHLVQRLLQPAAQPQTAHNHSLKQTVASTCQTPGGKPPSRPVGQGKGKASENGQTGTAGSSKAQAKAAPGNRDRTDAASQGSDRQNVCKDLPTAKTTAIKHEPAAAALPNVTPNRTLPKAHSKYKQPKARLISELIQVAPPTTIAPPAGAATATAAASDSSKTMKKASKPAHSTKAAAGMPHVGKSTQGSKAVILGVTTSSSQVPIAQGAVNGSVSRQIVAPPGAADPQKEEPAAHHSEPASLKRQLSDASQRSEAPKKAKVS